MPSEVASALFRSFGIASEGSLVARFGPARPR